MNGNGEGQWIILARCDKDGWQFDLYRGDDYDELVTSKTSQGYAGFMANLDKAMSKENQDAHRVKPKKGQKRLEI